MPNRLVTLEDAAASILAEANRVCDEHGIPEKDRARLVSMVLAPLSISPAPPSYCDECGERQDLDGAWHKKTCSAVSASREQEQT